MQIVVEVSDKFIENLLDGKETFLEVYDLLRRIANSTTLPKGHGRLIDADELREEMYTCETNGRPFYVMELGERLAIIDEAPTIIEADIEETIEECGTKYSTDETAYRKYAKKRAGEVMLTDV